ncbi:NADPH-dependent FMN reductase [Vibrio mexicanus]|uniref:NADPH-dependent FMN reductase n=1 Tax=Vibrio mexicanus TaxID=1004326 RepID=UPI00063C1563|nr:NAD(P)H-dependent oxidoreductase [Vibrio mexicanus]
MNITIISGSQRANSKSLSAAHYLKSLALEHFEQANILDLHELNLPLWNEGVWQKTEEWKQWEPTSELLKQSDAVVLISPEWHGMATPALKNFLLLTTAEDLAHKPVLLASVSANINGVYPISELRMTGSKNNHACFIPDHLMFRNVETLLTADHQITDQHMHERSQYTIALLASYAEALKPVHEAMLPSTKEFRFSM